VQIEDKTSSSAHNNDPAPCDKFNGSNQQQFETFHEVTLPLMASLKLQTGNSLNRKCSRSFQKMNSQKLSS
jgi:hypothetical protein